jgi:predicted DNA-binding transcriptional regulator YafY
VASRKPPVTEFEFGLTISLKLNINYELLSLLLGFCPEACVLQPDSLKNKLDE